METSLCRGLSGATSGTSYVVPPEERDHVSGSRHAKAPGKQGWHMGVRLEERIGVFLLSQKHVQYPADLDFNVAMFFSVDYPLILRT